MSHLNHRIKTFYAPQYCFNLQHLYNRNSALGHSCWILANGEHDCYLLTDTLGWNKI